MSSVGTRGSALAVGFAFPIIDGILVSLRFYARRQLNVDRGIDDWLCIPAWLCLTGCCASMLTGIYKGAFDDDPLEPDQMAKREQTLAQVTAALVIFWMGANCLIKLIMLFFYRRIFKVTGKAFNLCNWTLIGMSIVWFIYAVASWLFYCGTNLRANFEGPWKGCAPWGFEIQMGVFAMDSFIDFCLLVMPIPFIWRIQLDWKKKLALVVVFVLGAFAFVAGLNNTIIQLVELTNPSLAHSGGAANFFQGSSLLFSNWPAIEIGVGLLASNLPPLSFRIARLLKDGLPRALRISINSIRHAAAAISLTSLHGSNRNNGPRQSHEEGRQGLWPDQASTQSVAPSHARSFEQNPPQQDKIYVSSEVKVERHGGDFV